MGGTSYSPSSDIARFRSFFFSQVPTFHHEVDCRGPSDNQTERIRWPIQKVTHFMRSRERLMKIAGLLFIFEKENRVSGMTPLLFEKD